MRVWVCVVGCVRFVCVFVHAWMCVRGCVRFGIFSSCAILIGLSFHWLCMHLGPRGTKSEAVAWELFRRRPIIVEEFSLFNDGRRCPVGGVVKQIKIHEI